MTNAKTQRTDAEIEADIDYAINITYTALKTIGYVAKTHPTVEPNQILKVLLMGCVVLAKDTKTPLSSVLDGVTLTENLFESLDLGGLIQAMREEYIRDTRK